MRPNRSPTRAISQPRTNRVVDARLIWNGGHPGRPDPGHTVPIRLDERFAIRAGAQSGVARVRHRPDRSSSSPNTSGWCVLVMTIQNDLSAIAILGDGLAGRPASCGRGRHTGFGLTAAGGEGGLGSGRGGPRRGWESRLWSPTRSSSLIVQPDGHRLPRPEWGKYGMARSAEHEPFVRDVIAATSDMPGVAIEQFHPSRRNHIRDLANNANRRRRAEQW